MSGGIHLVREFFDFCLIFKGWTGGKLQNKLQTLVSRSQDLKTKPEFSPDFHTKIEFVQSFKFENIILIL